MTNVPYERVHECKSGLVLKFYEDGELVIEDAMGDVSLSYPDQIEVQAQIRKEWGMDDEYPGVELDVPAIGAKLPPFPIVTGIVIQGADGPEMVVDLAEQLKEMAIRNARLTQDLAALEDCRDRLAELLSVRNGQA